MKYYGLKPNFEAFNNPGLKSWVIDNEAFTDFNPKISILINAAICHIG
jgi:hypothetical protein